MTSRLDAQGILQRVFDEDANALRVSGGGAIVSATAPADPADGDLWWESDTGTLFAYDEGVGWVEPGGGGGGAIPAPADPGDDGKVPVAGGGVGVWTALPGGGDMLAANNLSDLASAATARTNLGVDAAGTDNSTDVTLAGSGTYLSLAGQEITVDQITESDISDLAHAVEVVSNVATARVLGRVTAGSGDSEELTQAQALTFLGVEAGATADLSGAEIKALYEAVADTNAFDDAAVTKLAGIETAADVTDAANVGAAGAPIITSGAGAPSSTPTKVGDIYVDTTGDTVWSAAGTASSADWKQATGAGGGDLLAANNLSDLASAATARTNLGLVIGTNVQAQDAELAAIAGLTSVADRLPYFTGSGTAALATFTAAGRALVDDASAAAQRTTLGVGTGDSPQLAAVNVGHASDTTLARASAGNLTVEGNALYRAGGTDVPVTDGGTGASDAATARTNLGLAIGTNVQAFDAELAALAGLTSAANKLPYFTGSGSAAVADLTADGRALIARAVNTVAAAGTTETLDGDDYALHDITLDEAVTFTFSTTDTVASFILVLRQDGTGGNSVTWPASVKWHAATAPTILTSASAVHVLVFLTVDAGTTWRGFFCSSNVS